jgi:iron uptake system EfeUOB component EfeO/EfeM
MRNHYKQQKQYYTYAKMEKDKRNAIKTSIRGS